MPIDIVPAGRFAPSAWVLVWGSDEYVDLGWSEDGTGMDYRMFGRFVTRTAAEGAMRAAEAGTISTADESLAASGFVKDVPTVGFTTGETTFTLGKGHGRRGIAWISDDLMETYLAVPGTDGPWGHERYGTMSLARVPGDMSCSFVDGRTKSALVIAMLLGAWESRPKEA